MFLFVNGVKCVCGTHHSFTSEYRCSLLCLVMIGKTNH